MVWLKVIIGALKTLMVLGIIHYIAPDLGYMIGYEIGSFAMGWHNEK